MRFELTFLPNIRNNMAKNQKNKRTTDLQIELYSTIYPLLKSLFTEIKDFSKKNQNDPINLSKVKIINRLLIKAKDILKDESSIEYLDILEEDNLPSMSDAVLIVSQYISALDKFHSDHYKYEDSFGLAWDNPGHWQ